MLYILLIWGLPTITAFAKEVTREFENSIVLEENNLPQNSEDRVIENKGNDQLQDKTGTEFKEGGTVEVDNQEDVNEMFLDSVARAGSQPKLEKIEISRDTGLLLTWSQSENVLDLSKTKYMILRSSDNGRSYQGIVNREAKYGLFFLDATELQPGKTYYYKVREFINGVQKEDSNVLSAVAQETSKADNEFTDKENAAIYLMEQMKDRNNKIDIIYNAETFPNGLGAELYDMAREDKESSEASSATEGDYLRYTIIPGTIKIITGIDGKVGNKTSYVFSYNVDYYTSRQEEDSVNQKVGEILAEFSRQGITNLSSEYIRIKTVYDYLSKNVKYNNEPRQDNGNLMLTAYDALVRQEAQCYGQVLATYRLLKELGITTRRINGRAKVELDGKKDWYNHGWNIVKVNGIWYNFDVTASASYYRGKGQNSLMTYRYLLISDQDIEGIYERSDDYGEGSLFNASHAMGKESFGCEPDAPAELKLITTNSKTVSAEYSKVEGAEGYILFRSDSETGKFIQVGKSKGLICKDTTAVSGKQYHYKVRAYKIVQGFIYYSDYSPRRIITQNTIGTPTGLKGDQYVYNSVKLSWNSAEGAKFYQIWRSNSKAGNYKNIATLDSGNLTYTSKNLLCGTTYYYKVRAYNFKEGERVFSSFSDIVSIMPTLKPPLGIEAKSLTYNMIKINWMEVIGANYYQVYRSACKDGKYVLIGTYNSSTFDTVSRSLKCGTTYYYKIRAYRWVGGNRIFSAFSSVASAKPVLSSPANIKARRASSSTVKISWNKVSGADYYQVYRATSINGKYVLLGTYGDSTTSSISRALKRGTRYYYKVRAYRWSGGERIFSTFSKITSAIP